jgi:hypothetical protein
MRYDRADATTTAIATLPDPATSPGPATPVQVGEQIALYTTRYDLATDAITAALLTYTADGEALAAVDLPYALDVGDYVLDMFPVTVTGTAYVGLVYATGGWELRDPVTGSAQQPLAPPAWFSPLDPAESLALSGTPYIDETYGVLYRWTLGGATLPYDGWPEGIALAPNGRSVAYVGVDGVYLGRGQPSRIPGTEAAGASYAALAWAPTALRAQFAVGGG